MAFCKYCGKQLNDGEVCNCQGSVQAAAQAQQVNAAQAQPNGAPNQANGMPVNNAMPNMANNAAQQNQFNSAQMQQYVEQGKEAATNTWKTLLGIFKAPAKAGREYVAKADVMVAGILVVLQAIVAGLFGLIVMMKMNAYTGVALFSRYTGKTILSGVKGLILTIIFSLILSALYCVVVFVSATVAKAEIDFKKALAVTSIRSAAVLPFMILACLIALLNVNFAFGVFYLGNLLAICYVYAAMSGLMEENKLCYVMVAIIFIYLIVAIFVMSCAVNLYMPKSVKGLSSLYRYLY